MRRIAFLAVLAACSKSDPPAAPDPAAACEQFNTRLRTCQDEIVKAVGARMPGSDLVGLRKRLTAPPSCAGARADQASPLVTCSNDDCDAMASCMADLLAPAPPPRVAATRAAATQGLNLVFVLIDTVRADRLGVAGYRRNGVSLTPRLDAFAAGAVRFTHAYAQAANTPRSLPSIWASRYPSQLPFKKVFQNFPPVDDSAELLFESLSAGGLFTTGFSSHFYFDPARNVTQGFNEYDNEGAKSVKDSNKDFAAVRIMPKAVARLEKLAAEQTRFAMFVHLFEPHSSYVTYAEYPVKAKGVDGLEEKYDYEIAVADRFVGDLLDAIDRTKLTDRTLVVIVSDHGEAFGTHRAEGKNLYFHGQALYDEILRVPLLVRAPGVTAAVRDDLVGLVDVAPTVLDVLDLPAPSSFQGRSLVPLLHGESLPPRPLGAVIQATPAWKHGSTAWISADGTEKIIAHDDGRLEVFDLAQDPGELHDLSEEDPARTKRLEAGLRAWEKGL